MPVVEPTALRRGVEFLGAGVSRAQLAVGVQVFVGLDVEQVLAGPAVARLQERRRHRVREVAFRRDI